MAFTFIDLFAGIGGFHAAMAAAGGECVLASEIDPAARRIYERNWGTSMRVPAGQPVVAGDITKLAPEEGAIEVPEHDVLCAGFPCQPFSKSGAQMGTRDRTRGTLYANILRILEERRPSVVFLENVRNLAGPRHRDTWLTIIQSLRELGYRVASEPGVFSPHLLPPDLGGAPQSRDRIFILGTYVGPKKALAQTSVAPVVTRSPVRGWDPQAWDVMRTPLHHTSGQPLITSAENVDRYRLTAEETLWIDAWDDLVRRYRMATGRPLPGFPIWADEWTDDESLSIAPTTPVWKASFLRKNAEWYSEHRSLLDAWLRRWNGLEGFPASRRKLEWQAQDAGSLWDCVLHLRPSGIRAKKPTYLPALVAITQTSIIGPLRRRVTARETARLQGLPDWFVIDGQPESAAYKQMGNGVNVGAVYHAFREHVLRDEDVTERISRQHLLVHPAPTIPREGLRAEDPGIDLLDPSFGTYAGAVAGVATA